jgi:hypothetical protein
MCECIETDQICLCGEYMVICPKLVELICLKCHCPKDDAKG